MMNFTNAQIKATLTICLLSLTACSGNRVVTTTDDSADYKSAVQLPPLIKTASSVPDVVDISTPPEIAEDNTGSIDEITASIEEVSANRVRMNIDATGDQAWDFVLDSLRDSEVTLQGRNKTANFFEIGCGDVVSDLDANQTGWRVFGADNEVTEYCLLKLTSNRGATQVTAFDRAGSEFSSSDATEIFNKIFNK